MLKIVVDAVLTSSFFPLCVLSNLCCAHSKMTDISKKGLTYYKMPVSYITCHSCWTQQKLATKIYPSSFSTRGVNIKSINVSPGFKERTRTHFKFSCLPCRSSCPLLSCSPSVCKWKWRTTAWKNNIEPETKNKPSIQGWHGMRAVMMEACDWWAYKKTRLFADFFLQK